MKQRAITFLLTISLFSFTLPSNEGVKFYQGTYDNMLREARVSKKPIILDFWASWCGPCKKLDKETFSNPEVARFIEDNFLIYKVDIDSNDGRAITEKFGVKQFPSMLILNNKAKSLEKLKGFYPASYLEKELIDIMYKHELMVPEGGRVVASYN